MGALGQAVNIDDLRNLARRRLPGSSTSENETGPNGIQSDATQSPRA